jgi:3-carboxy-cis,cis-muconate cycloisomerase
MPQTHADVLRALTMEARVQRMLDVEAALARAEAEADIVPGTAATAIERAARVDRIDLAALAADGERAGNLAIPLVKQLTRVVSDDDADAGRYVHWGATSQDIIDTALVLQLREAVPFVIADLGRAARAAAGHARRHAATPMAGRTWLQQSTPITFGLKAAGWADALQRTARSASRALDEALVLQFGGASGTLAALGGDGLRVADALAGILRLRRPPIPWHAHRERLAALSCALGVACGTLGKIGRDVTLLSQTEVQEAAESAGQAGGSSTMPQKRNPVNASRMLASALRAPGLVATMLGAMVQEHERGPGGWQAEWETLPELVRVAAGAAAAGADMLEGLTVDERQMEANLETTGGLVMAEAVAMRLARHVGKQEAHALVQSAARDAAAGERPVAAVLAGNAAIARWLDRDALTEVLTPANYLGAAPQFIADVLAGADAKGNDD